MTCPDLCTAAKCQELENRIGALEQALELLEASFEAHTQQQIPEAHDYEPNVIVDFNLVDNDHLFLDVSVDNNTDSADVIIPVLETPEVIVDFNLVDDLLFLDVSVGDSSDTADVRLPLSQLPYVDVQAQYQPEDNLLGIIVSLYDPETGEENLGQDVTEIVMPEYTDPQVSVGVYKLDDLTFGISVTVGSNQDQDSFTITLPDMNCDELLNELQNCCSQILNAINDSRSITTAEIEDSENNLNNKLDGVKNELIGDLLGIKSIVDEVQNYVTIDISGTVNTKYKYKFPVDENESPISSYAEAEVEGIDINSKGLLGIQRYLSVISTNLDSIYNDVCKAIDPISSITIDDLYRYCDANIISRDDFDNTSSGDAKYAEAKEQYINNLLSNSKYSYLLTGRDLPNANRSNTLMRGPNNWITPVLSDFALIQSRINNKMLCDPDELPAIVASDRFVTKASGKLLILHFVTLENYPKRARDSSYRPVQIPAPLDSYDWIENFKDLRWNQGNLFAELRFKQNYVPVSGWFANKEAADIYFDAILNLTTATEDDRVYPEHKTPKTNIPVRLTRPYRAFITSVNNAGRGVVHTKYVPVIEDDDT